MIDSEYDDSQWAARHSGGIGIMFHSAALIALSLYCGSGWEKPVLAVVFALVFWYGYATWRRFGEAPK
jgi:hypothetical protein